MVKGQKRGLCLLLASVLIGSSLTPSCASAADNVSLRDKAVGRYNGDYKPGDPSEDGIKDGDNTEFIKISHPEKGVSKKEFDPTESPENRKKHEEEVNADGLLDYIGSGVVEVPGSHPDANGQGDRGQTYSWAGFAYGDWMYVSTLFNSTESTGRLLGKPVQPDELDLRYGGDMYTNEFDNKEPGSTLSKINVKTGEVKIIMSGAKNKLETSFRSAVEFKGKLYFCGSVNHLPSIYEVDPVTDAFQCVYQDPSIKNHPGGPGQAWAESLEKKICPTIRGITVFKDYLVISTVGMDGNPYIAVSNDPSSGQFTRIASTWSDVENKVPGELLGYPACRIQDSIMGGSIWEMIEFNDKLYVAIATGTPEDSIARGKTHVRKDEDGNPVLDKDGNPILVIDEMQSFAIVTGTFDEGTEENPNSVADPSAWTWEPLVGDIDDGAKYTFGIDPERTRSGACNMVVFDEHLYIGEYNDTQIAFQNLTDNEFDFLAKNLEQSVSLYRMDKEENIEKVMGQPTKMFPEALSDINESGFGRRESQYIWQTKVFNGKLYLGTFDETAILYPLADAAEDALSNAEKENLKVGIEKITAYAEDVLAADSEEQAAFALNEEEEEVQEKEAASEEKAAQEEEIVQKEEAEQEEVTQEEVTQEETQEEAEQEETTQEEEAAQDAKEEAVNPEVELARKILEAKEFFEMKKESGLLSDIVDEKSESMLPASLFENGPMIEVNSPDSLYLALLMIDDLVNPDKDATVRQRLASELEFCELYEEVTSYLKETMEELPEFMKEAAEQATSPVIDERTKTILGILQYLKECVDGFDMYVTEDGMNFKQITRSGLGDPYNQGLRVFAANDDPDNSWMCIGTANPFYGTQIWRMEDQVMNTQALDPKQETVKVRFIQENGKQADRRWDTPDEIYVVKGTTTVKPSDLENILPTDTKLKNTKEVTILQDENGQKYIEIPVLTDTKDVALRFMDVNKQGDEQMVGTAQIKVLKSKKVVNEEAIAEVLPKGYKRADNEKVEIKSQGESGYFADVPVVSQTAEPIVGLAVTGHVKSYISNKEAVKIELYKEGSEQPSYETTVTGNHASYVIDELEAGTYKMVVSKKGHATREYDITVDSDRIEQQIDIHPLGDVSLDGNIKMQDWEGVYKHLNGMQTLEGYAAKCADVNNDNVINMQDWERIYKHLNGSDLFW